MVIQRGCGRRAVAVGKGLARTPCGSGGTAHQQPRHTMACQQQSYWSNCSMAKWCGARVCHGMRGSKCAVPRASGAPLNLVLGTGVKCSRAGRCGSTTAVRSTTTRKQKSAVHACHQHPSTNVAPCGGSRTKVPLRRWKNQSVFTSQQGYRCCCVVGWRKYAKE